MKITTKKNISSLFFLMLIFCFSNSVKSQCFTAPNYCTSITAANNANYGMGIQNVTLYTSAVPVQVNNTTVAGQGTQIYFNFTSMVATALAGDTVYFSIKGGSSNQTIFRIYIDYNNDGTFNTTSPELVYTSANLTVANTVVNSFFIVPTAVTAGVYRLRVASDGQGIIPPPCGPITYSAEFEDYTLLVPGSSPDAMSNAITSPMGAIVGNNTVAFSFRNLSSATLTSIDIGYQLGTNTPVLQSLSSLSIAPGALYTATFTTLLNLTATGTFNLRVWQDNPNSTGTITPVNDTICKDLVTYCSGPLSGVYTINPSGSGSTNFKSFGGADSALQICGISGAVIFNVSPGVYTDRIYLPSVTGASAVNTIKFNCTGSTLQYSCNASNYSVVMLQGAKYVTIDGLNIKPLNATYAWGIHFYQNADYNSIKNCIIDYSSVTTTGTTAVGIVFSNSLTSPTSAGANGKGDTIQNCYIKGHPTTGGPYYGICHLPQANNTILSGNKFINNIIENVYSYGMYMNSTYGTLIKGNIFRNPTRTSNTTMYGIYLINSDKADTIIGNAFSSPFGTAITTTNTYYGIYMATPNAQAGSEIIIANNNFYNMQSNGPIYGIYGSSSSYIKVFHNTFSFDHLASTSANPTYGFYFSGTPGGLVDFRNNIVHITRGGAGVKYALYLTSASTFFTINNNVYFMNGLNSYIGYYAANFQTFNDWRTANGGLFDAAGSNINPIFVNSAIGNLTPIEGFINNKGANLSAIISTDFTGATRSTTPDPGSYEFVPPALDAGVQTIIFPSAPFAAGTVPINVTIRNSGTTTITGATINWIYNGITQTPYLWTGSLTGGSVSANVLLGSITAAPATPINITAWTSVPNGVTDANILNDSASIVNAFCALSGGTYTVNAGAPASATNFQSFNLLSLALNNGGIFGAVTLNVVASSGPYTGQLEFKRAPGVSITNTITINGNGNIIQANPDANKWHIILLNGADYMRFNNLVIRTQNVSYGVGYLFMNRADSNIIDNNTIDFSNINSGNTAFIAFSSATNSVTSAAPTYNGIYNIIRNCLLTGNGAGGPTFGITVMGGTTDYTSTTLPQYNQFIDNDMRDPYTYGFYTLYGNRNLFKGNKISHPTRTMVSTFYAFYTNTNYIGDTLDGNQIFDIYKSVPTNSSQFTGIYCVSAAYGNASFPQIIKNNLIYNIKGLGAHYGIYNVGSYYFNLYHNTIVLDDPGTSTSITYALYSSTGTTTHNYGVRNNIFYINRGGTGNKYCIYIPSTFTPSGTFVINNNAFFVNNNSTNGYVGYYGGNFQTLTNWKAANSSAFDQASVFANPNFRTYIAPNYFQPGNDTLNNIGFNLAAVVPKDISGVNRATTPDPGIYEFSVPGVDVGLTRVSEPVSPITTGYQDVKVVVKNFAPAALTSASIGWAINDTVQTTNYWSGYINNGDTSVFTVGNYNFAYQGIYRIKAWSSLPNAQADSFTFNDTVTATVCTPISGTLTVNAALPASGSNFQSMSTLMSMFNLCGIAGPVIVNIAPGTYNGQLTLSTVPGLSAINNITFNGADSATTRFVHDGSVSRATLLLNGAKNLVFRKITFEASSQSNGTAVQLINNADSNTFVKCTFKAAITTTSTVNTFIASGSVTSPTTLGNCANYLLIDSCTATGGYYGFVIFSSNTPKGVGNIVRNSLFNNSYVYGMYLYYQNGISILNNNINSIGVNQNYTSPYCIYLYSSDNANSIMGNSISNTLGGYGIYMYQTLGNSSSKSVCANNMIQIGAVANITYGIFDYNNAYTDFAYNTVKLNTAEAGYNGAALYSYNLTPATYNNVKIVNNIFISPFGALAVYVVTPSNLGTALYTIDNNVYYSTATYPFRGANTIFGTLTGYSGVGNANALGNFIPTNNSHSQFFLPAFFSSTNLRSISSNLNDSGLYLPNITVDIDGNTRGIPPDIGINDFSKPANDAGAVAVLTPTQPLIPGISDIKVLIGNFGTSNITSVNVTCQIDTFIRTLVYSGTMLPGGFDTVWFNATSGPGGTSQQYNFLGGQKLIKVWTSQPNSVMDSVPLNDTVSTNICGGLSGVYTINPSLSASATNFISLQAAIDKMVCGGVYGPVIFNIAPGTYNGQLIIPVITGTSATNTILFKAANNNPASVIITSSTATVGANYTLSTVGLQNATFRYITFSNTHATYARIISINKWAATNTNTSEVEFRDCVFNGLNVSQTSDQYALVYGPTGEYATNLRFVNNIFNYGSIAIVIGGQNIVNNFTPGLNIDTCAFNNQYYSALWLTNRAYVNIRHNAINLSPAYAGTFGMYIVGLQNECAILRNNIQNPSGNYGLYLINHAYYAAPGNAVIANNVINMQSASATEYGLYIASSSQVVVYNNTIKTNTSSTASYGIFSTGNPSFVNGLTFPATNNMKFSNNILYSNGGTPIYLDLLAKAGTNQCDYNLYYTSGTNIANLAATNYTSMVAMRNSFYPGSDMNSLNRNILFSGTNYLKPDATSPLSWNANGRGIYQFSLTHVPRDIDGVLRSNDVLTGVPDIGAYEITPTVMPAPLSINGSIGSSSTQYLIDNTDTLGTLIWGSSGTLPTGITAYYFPGSLISNPSAYGINFTAKYMDMHYRIVATGGSGFGYDVSFKYKPIMLGTVSSESEIKFAKRDTGSVGLWTHFSTSTVLDTLNKTFGATYLSTMADFTGTDDLSPLPVKLSQFEAFRNKDHADLIWQTVNEINSSRFEIERSEKGSGGFTRVGEVKASGNSVTIKQYNYTDKNVAGLFTGKTIYYRLKIIDRDESFEYSQVKPVFFGDIETNAIHVFPNPFTSDLLLQVNLVESASAQVNVFDLQGRQVYTEKMQLSKGGNRLKVELTTTLPSGFYIIKVAINDEVLTQKLIKE